MESDFEELLVLLCPCVVVDVDVLFSTPPPGTPTRLEEPSSATDPPVEKASDGLSSGAIVGITIGSFAGVAAVGELAKTHEVLREQE